VIEIESTTIDGIAMSDDEQTTNGNGKAQAGQAAEVCRSRTGREARRTSSALIQKSPARSTFPVDTLWRNPKFAEVYKRGAEGGRKSLRRMQFESANKGNVIMQIFLGKVYLGQCDNPKEVRPLPIEDLEPKHLCNCSRTCPRRS